ncbi:MAG: MBOAT family O-acyltransferase [Oscillospiraceae bacterium]|nr:MBOAT family O-acyltransferase [Oscillospiraceae bacterium]
MTFSSMSFLWMFLPAVLVIYWAVPSANMKRWWLLFSSAVFYCWCDAKAFPLFCAFVLFNWLIGKIIPGRKWMLFAGLAADIGLLCYYKYVPGAGQMPLGLSFYTFLGVSYIVDRYRGDIQGEVSLPDSALFFSFFPRVMSGPLERYGAFKENESKPDLSTEKIAYGIKRFIIGLAKKAIISDQLAPSVSGLFLLDIGTAPSLYMWVAVLLYTVQIYYDFSGYSDMAIGLTAMLGYDIPENFDHPYSSRSMTEFWRTWHMTLSHWFRDYIYIPLGGNRKGLLRTCINLGVVYLVTGIWHGAGLCFIAWGLWNGVFVILERLGLSKWLRKLPGFLQHCYTMFIVIIGWTFFRAGSLTRALQMLKAMIIPHSGDALPIRMFVGPGTWAIFLIGLLFSFAVDFRLDSIKKTGERAWEIIETAALILLFFVSVLFIASGSYSSFIYFQF